MKQSEIARALHLTVQRISQLVARGMPTTSIDAARDWYRTNIERRESPTAEVTRILVTAKARRNVTEARVAELEHRLAIGELRRVDEVSAALRSGVMACREALMGIPGRTADLIAATDDAIQIRRLLEDEIMTAIGHIERLRDELGTG